MPRTLAYFFTLLSPWSCLGHVEIMALAERHDLRIVWKPMSLSTVFPASGGLPLAQRHPKRQAYRDIELQRWRLTRGMRLNLRPAFWPVDIGLADRTVIALAERGADPDPFVRAAFAGLWVEEADLADEATIVRLLGAAGCDAGVIATAKTPDIATLYDANSKEALDAGVFGAPTYILDGEPFWGQDRIGLLDEALKSRRTPFTEITPASS